MFPPGLTWLSLSFGLIRFLFLNFFRIDDPGFVKGFMIVSLYGLFPTRSESTEIVLHYYLDGLCLCP